MNKIIKKWCLIVVVFCLVIFNTINVEAVTQPTTSSETLIGNSSYKKVIDKGSFKIRDISGNSYDRTTFSLYKLVDVYYNLSNNDFKYQFTPTFQTFISGGYASASFQGISIDDFMSLNKGDASHDASGYVIGGNLSTNQFASLMSDYAYYIRNSNISANASISNRATNSEFVEGTNIPVGTYLALPSSISSRDNMNISVFATMVDSISLVYKTDQGGYWEVKDGMVVSKSSFSVLNHTISKTYNGSFSSSAIVGYADVPEGKISFSVPTYPANGSEGRATITIEKVRNESGWVYFKTSGFTIENPSSTGGTIKYNGETVGTMTRNSSTGQAVVNFTTLKGLPSNIEMTYHPEQLSISNSVIGNNSRSVTIAFTDPYSNDSSVKASQTKTVTLTTYALQITGISGAEFQVKDSSGNSMGTVAIGSNGLGELKGLANGVYTITQTKAPNGYTLITGSQTVQVGSGGTAVSGKTGYYGITIRNSVLAILPYTGSVGTIIFTVLGCLLIIGSIVFIIAYKRKKRQN